MPTFIQDLSVDYSEIQVPESVESTDQVTLQLYDLGGTGPLLILCHATGFCGQVWQPMMKILGEAFRCVTFDFRAHGASSAPVGRSLTWHGMADDVQAVADALSPGEPIVAVGHSMGGTSLILAENARPGTVAKAWTYEPILFDKSSVPGPDPSEISTAARKRRDTFANRQEVLDRYSSRPPLSMLDPRALQAYVDYGFVEQPDGSVTLRCRPEHEAEIFEHHNTGARSLVGNVTVPFVMAASGDGQVPAEEVMAAADEYAHLELVRYPQLSHFGPLQDPDGVATDIVAWLQAN